MSHTTNYETARDFAADLAAVGRAVASPIADRATDDLLARLKAVDQELDDFMLKGEKR